MPSPSPPESRRRARPLRSLPTAEGATTRPRSPALMHDHDHEPISPELVLVDPELAARVRAVAVAGPSLDQPVTASPSVERSGGAGREPATPPPAAPASVPTRAPAPAP